MAAFLSVWQFQNIHFVYFFTVIFELVLLAHSIAQFGWFWAEVISIYEYIEAILEKIKG